MKKIIFVLIVGTLSIGSLSSCKKDYTCHCTIYFENGANLVSKDEIRATSIGNAAEDCNAIGAKDAETQTEVVQNIDCHL